MDTTQALFQLRCSHHVWFNAGSLRRRDFAGQIASMKQAGRHWIMYLLGHTLAELYDKPPPHDIHDQRFIGNPKRQPGPAYPEMPQLVSSHALPHALMFNRPVARALRFPRYLVIVRDMRHGLVSSYEKWKDTYRVDFATYLRSSPRRKRYRFTNDIWRQIEFLNTWGRVAAMPEYDTLVVRYEQLQTDTPGTLRRVCEHFGIQAPDDTIQRAVQASSKDKMAAKNTRDEPGFNIVRRDKRHPFTWYTQADRAAFNHIVNRHLRHRFGYDYDDWSTPPQTQHGPNAAQHSSAQEKPSPGIASPAGSSRR